MRRVCGLDVHKDSIYMCILYENGSKIESVFIQDTHINAIFVNIKTTYSSHNKPRVRIRRKRGRWSCFLLDWHKNPRFLCKFVPCISRIIQNGNMKYGVNRKVLLITAGVVWIIAGGNILRIGIMTWLTDSQY